MRKLLFVGIINIISIVFLVSSLYANYTETIFDNGSWNPDQFGTEMTKDLITEEFLLTSDASINRVVFWGFDGGGESYPGPAYKGQISYFIYDDMAGNPYDVLAQGIIDVSPIDTGSDLVMLNQGGIFDILMFDFTIPEFDATADTTYHLGLHNGAITWEEKIDVHTAEIIDWYTGDYVKTNFYWATTQPDGTSNILRNLYHQDPHDISYTGWIPYQVPYNLAFQLLYTEEEDLSAVPEPASLLLLGCALLGLAGLREKYKK